jgi:hypothetical protein
MRDCQHPNFPGNIEIDDRDSDLIEEPLAEPRTLLVVHQSRVIELTLGFGFEPKLARRYLARRPSIRCFTSSQGVPGDSPARTLRARRSISAAHAFSSSCGSSVNSSSRLASNSAAMSARSRRGSLRASWSSVSRVIRFSLPATEGTEPRAAPHRDRGHGWRGHDVRGPAGIVIALAEPLGSSVPPRAPRRTPPHLPPDRPRWVMENASFVVALTRLTLRRGFRTSASNNAANVMPAGRCTASRSSEPNHQLLVRL